MSARADPRGGRSAMVVPTATSSWPCAGHLSVMACSRQLTISFVTSPEAPLGESRGLAPTLAGSRWQAGKNRIPLGWRDHPVLCFSLSPRVWAGWSMVRRPLCLVGVDGVGRAVFSGGPYSPHDALVDTVFRWVRCTRLTQEHCGRYRWPRLVSSALAFLAPRSSRDGRFFRCDRHLADEVC